MVVWRGLSQDGLGPTTQQDSNGLPFLEHILKLHPGQGTTNDHHEVYATWNERGHVAVHFSDEPLGSIAHDSAADTSACCDTDPRYARMRLSSKQQDEVPRDESTTTLLNAHEVSTTPDALLASEGILCTHAAQYACRRHAQLLGSSATRPTDRRLLLVNARS